MLKYKPKPYKESQLQYYSYINYNFVNDYLLEEDNVLSNIDADLPTSKELVEQRKRYNAISKKMDSQIRKQRANKILNPHFLYEHQISVIEDSEDIYVVASFLQFYSQLIEKICSTSYFRRKIIN